MGTMMATSTPMRNPCDFDIDRMNDLDTPFEYVDRFPDDIYPFGGGQEGESVQKALLKIHLDCLIFLIVGEEPERETV
jgi:hypothetical protein